MIDRQALKNEAKQNMLGKKPSVFLVAATYVAVISVLSVLLYSLSGYDKFYNHVQQILDLNLYPTYDELRAAIPALTPIAGLLMLTVLMSNFVLDIGFMGYCLKLTRNEEAGIRVIFDAFVLFIKIIWLNILQLVFVFLWSLLFIAPGIIAYYGYRQAFYILLDNPETRPIDCIRQSKRLMAGNRLELFSLDFSFVGWYILGDLLKALTALPLFSIWLAPYAGAARAGFYNKLLADTSPKEA
jgi:uncharacterized membrane protein